MVVETVKGIKKTKKKSISLISEPIVNERELK